MKKIAILLSVLILIIMPVKAQLTATISYTPTTPLPGDVVKGTITLKATTPETVNGITFMTNLDVTPKDVSGIGTFYGEYSLPFTIKTTSAGTYTVKVYIFTENGTLVKTFNLNVINSKPEIVITSPITLNEVNVVHFTVINPVDAKDIVVIPLFKAYPSSIALNNYQGSFQFYPTKKTPLKFRIEFFNGLAENFHSYVETVYPSYKKSSGITFNVSTPHEYYLLYDVIPISVEISNLRGDAINSVKVAVSTGNFEKVVEIPEIPAGNSNKVVVNCPALKPGKESISINVSYRDTLGNIYFVHKNYTVTINPEKAVKISDYSIERNLNGVEVTGDVSNSGWSKVYGVTVMAGNKSYFIGTIDPSDYDTFDIITHNVTSLKVVWQNSLGQVFSNEVKVHYRINAPKKVKSSNSLFIAVIGSLLVIVLALIGFLRRKK